MDEAVDGLNGFVFMVLLCSMPFSLLIAYLCAFWGDDVSASSSSTIFSFDMWAVNMSLTHSSSVSPQSARHASLIRWA